MLDPRHNSTNGADHSAPPAFNLEAADRQRQLKARRWLAAPRAQFEMRCVDTESLLAHLAGLAEGLRGLWLGLTNIRTHEDRAAAIAGARSVMLEIEHYLEQVTAELDRTEQASAKLHGSNRVRRRMRRR